MTTHDELVALYEVAKAEFDALQRSIHEQLMAGKAPSASELEKEELARSRLYAARYSLFRRDRSAY
jgi:hypothetical protein